MKRIAKENPSRPAVCTSARSVRYVAACILPFALAGCGASDGTTGDTSSADESAAEAIGTEQQSGGASGAQTSSAGAESAEGAGAGGDGQTLIVGAVPADDAASQGASECARESFEGERRAVNLHMLVDISGSMDTPISQDATRWDAVRDAIVEFINSAESEGLNLALSLYPKQEPRELCTTHAQCEAGICMTNVCLGEMLWLDLPAFCEPNQFGRDASCEIATVDTGDGFITPRFVDDLTPQDTLVFAPDVCVPPGRCDNDPLVLCVADDQCPGGSCMEPGESICPGVNSCEVDDYREPAVPISALPGGATDLTDVLSDIEPDVFALTPTHVGLRGAFDHSAQWLNDDPQTRSFVVLATDGFPRGCGVDDPLGQSLNPSDLTLEELEGGSQAGIDTFIIGVVDESLGADNGRAALTEMAVRGGTDEPLIVTADDATANGFLAALDAIRGQVLPCEFKIPEPEIGGTDLRLVNVEVQEGGDTTLAPQVEDQAACVDDSLGWHYDVPIADNPSSIVLCPQTCDRLSSSVQNQVDVVLGCETVRQVR